MRPTPGQNKIWMVMRKLGTFTVEELITLTSSKERFVKQYINALKASKYLRAEGFRSAGRYHNYRVYRMVKNTGTLAPVVRVVIYDPNLKEYVTNVD